MKLSKDRSIKIYSSVVLIVNLLAFGLTGILGFTINGHALSLGEYILQLCLILFNVCCLYSSDLTSSKIILVVNLIFLSIVQETTWETLLALALIGVLLIIIKKSSIKTVIRFTVIGLLNCVMMVLLVSIITCQLRVGKEVYKAEYSPNEEYVIETVKWRGIASDSETYYICRKNNGVYVLFFRLIPNAANGFFDYEGDSVSFKWLNDTEFSMDGEVYSVYDFPVIVDQ